MNEFENQILESWSAHNKIMMFVLENIPDEAFENILNQRKCRFFSRQFAHMYMIRVWRLEATGKKWVKNLKELGK